VYGRRMAAVWLCTAPGFAAAAGTDCHYVLECLAGDGCYEADFSAEIASADPQTFTSSDGQTEIAAHMGQLTSVSETVVGVVAYHKDHPQTLPSMFVSLPSGAAHWLTIQEDGKSFYTVHLAEADLSVTYRGTCKMKAAE